MRRTWITVLVLLAATPFLLFAGGEQEESAQGEGESAPAGGIDKIVVAINNAPWLPGYEGLAEQYEEETGIEVDIRAFPFTQLTDRARSAAQSDQSEFDVITMNTSGSAQFYSAGLVTPLKEIDPDFELDPAIIEYFHGIRWDPEEGNTADGAVVALPINGNIQIFYYRADLYEEAGLDPPETWSDVIEASNQIANPDEGLFGYAVRGKRGTLSVSWDFYPFLRGMGGRVFRNPPEDWTVVLNSEEGLAALELYLELANEHSPPNASNIGQSEQIALLQSGRLLQTIVVSGAFANVDDPDRSNVVGDIQYVVLPRPEGGEHAANIGELVQGIPQNLPAERKQAALDFLTYLTSFESQVAFAEFGGVPIRTDVYENSEISDDEKYRYFDATLESEPYLVGFPRIPETIQYTDVLEQRLNEAITGQLTAQEALELAAEEIYQILDDAGYQTGLE
mgnify:CR=1 FL=1